MLRKISVFLLMLAVILFGQTMTSEAAIVRVARSLNMIEFHGGYANPWGTYHQINNIPFYSELQDALVELDAGEVYDPAFYLGLNYGQLKSGRFMLSIGFRWTHINLDNELEFTIETPSLNQYDIDLNANYYFADPSKSAVAPYAGLGLSGGLNSATGNFIESEHEVTLAAGINFGADFVLWKAPNSRSFMALSSANNYVLTASDERPKYLNIGAALKYYFRP